MEKCKGKSSLVLGVVALVIHLSGCCEVTYFDDGETIDFSEQKDVAESLVSSYTTYLSEHSPTEARSLIVDALKDTEGVVDAGLSSDNITVWWHLADGTECILVTETRPSITETTKGHRSKSSTTEEGATREGHTDERIPAGRTTLDYHRFPMGKGTTIVPIRKALILSPYQWDWKLLGISIIEDETVFIDEALRNVNFSVTYKWNAEKISQNIGLDDYKHFDEYGVVAISSHGGLTSSNEVCIATGVVATNTLYEEYREDRIDGSLVMVVYVDKWFTDDDILSFAITPSWMKKHYPQKLEGVIFYASVCEGLFNDSFATTVTGGTASGTYWSWDHNIPVPNAAKTGKDLFTQLTSNGLNCGDAYQAIVYNGNHEYVGLLGPTAAFKYLGNANLGLVAAPVKIGTTPASWDDMGSLLGAFGHTVSTIQLSELSDYSLISSYDIIAVNCAPGLSGYSSGATDSIRSFVEQGGRLYASDYAYVFVQDAFPGYITFPLDPKIGTVQTVGASIVDEELSDYLGVQEIDISYDLSSWVVIDTVSESAETILTASISGTVRPLAVRFDYGLGRVVFTTFHNEAQASEEMRYTLEYFTIF